MRSLVPSVGSIGLSAGRSHHRPVALSTFLRTQIERLGLPAVRIFVWTHGRERESSVNYVLSVVRWEYRHRRFLPARCCLCFGQRSILHTKQRMVKSSKPNKTHTHTHIDSNKSDCTIDVNDALIRGVSSFLSLLLQFPLQAVPASRVPSFPGTFL